MGQELIARKFGHGVHEQEEFNDDEKSVYQLIHAQVGGALNTGDLTSFKNKYMAGTHRTFPVLRNFPRKLPLVSVSSVFPYSKGEQ